MNRNIVTVRDVAAWKLQAESAAKIDKVKELAEKTSVGPGPRVLMGGESAAGAMSVDSWYARLAKAIPAEALSLYLALDRGIRGPEGTVDPALVRWLAAALIIALIFNVVFLKVVWKVRPSQIAVSTVALVAYVFVMGGVFEQMKLTEPRAQVFVLIVTAAFLSLFRPIEPPVVADPARPPK